MSTSNDQLYVALLEIKEDIGSLTARMENHQGLLERHFVDDAKMAESIRHIENKFASQRGSIKVWGLVATTAATIGGIAASIFRHHT